MTKSNHRVCEIFTSDAPWRVEKFDDDGGLPSAADGKFELLKDHSQRFELQQQWLLFRVVAWRNSLISVRQSSSVRSRGHSAASGSQQLIGGIFRRDFDIGDHCST